MARLIVNADQGKHTISRHLYGHFAEHLGRCIYEGLWVGEDSPMPNTRGLRNDVLAALQRLGMPNLRWPGGCFADTYHWRDGVGPRGERPCMVNVHWGGTTEDNHFGTHEFLDLCELLGSEGNRCEPYICGNVGSGTVQEMSQWLEYITMPGQSPMAALRRRHGREEAWPLTYWAVGNENWGCGGTMRPQFYADVYRQFQTFCRNFAGKRLYKVACGHTDDWNEVLMREAGPFMDGLSIHYYTVPGPWHRKGSATRFSEDEWYITLKKALAVDDFLARTQAIMDRFDPGRRVGMVLDEWGTWYEVEPGTNPGFLYQQNTLRDALVAAVSFHVFHTYAQRLHMANIAQTINVLQAMVLTDGPRMLCTPTYHVFEMYRPHQGATALPVFLDTLACGPAAQCVPQVSASASRDAAGRIHLSLCNLSLEKEAEVESEVRGVAVSTASGRILTDARMNAHNTFEQPEALGPVEFDGALLGRGGKLTVKLPAKAVVMLELG